MSQQDAATIETAGRTIGIGGVAALFLALLLVVAPASAVAFHPSSSNEASGVFANRDQCPRVAGNFPASNGSTATVDLACLPDEGGFVGIYRYTSPNQSEVELIGVSEYISEGKRRNITVSLFDVPNKTFDKDAFNSTTQLLLRVHKDTNDNQQFDFIETHGRQDGVYTKEQTIIIHDSDPLPVESADSNEGANGKAKDDGKANNEATATATDTAHDGGNGKADKDSDSDETLPNTLRIQSTSDERAQYELSVSGSIEAKNGLDLTNASAKVPDDISADGSDGSVAERGVDNFTFSGNIATFTLTGGSANVSVNGEQIDPSDYSDTRANTSEKQPTTNQSQSEADASNDTQQTTTPIYSDSRDDFNGSSSESDSTTQEPATQQEPTTQQEPATQQVAGSQADSDPNGPSITFENQSTEGQTVTIESVTVPDGGFVVIHGSLYQEGIGIPDTYAYSQYLSPGTHQNVTIDISTNVPGAMTNVSRLNRSELLTATLHRDTNGNQQFNFFDLNSDSDVAYTTDDNNPVEDTAIVRVSGSNGVVMPGGTGESTPRDPGGNGTDGTDGSNRSGSATPALGIDFPDQGTQGATVTIDSVRLPEGGYVVVHNASYLPPLNDSLGSVIGVSEYLSPGNHTDVTVSLFNYSGYNGTQRRLQQSQKLVASINYESSGNQQFDFITSGGADDVGYLYGNNTLVYDTAFVTVSESAGQTQAGTAFGNETITRQTTAGVPERTAQTEVPKINIEGQQIATPTQTTQAPEEQQSGGATGFIFSGLTVIILLVLVGALAVAGVVYRRS